MNITCELEKKLILLFKTNNLFKNLINNVYTYVPENPTYPFVKITCIRKENYYESIENLNTQRERFRQHIRAAIHSGKPLIIHTRQAAEDTIKILQEDDFLKMIK